MTARRIVVGLDFSPASLDAARWAARHLGRDVELVLAHVVAIPEPPPIVEGRYPRRELLVDTVREGADRRLRDLGRALAPTRSWLEIREGEVTPTLAALAREYGAELLVVGAHGERTGTAAGLGSTAARLVHDATVPVLLVAGAGAGGATSAAPDSVPDASPGGAPAGTPEHARAAAPADATADTRDAAARDTAASDRTSPGPILVPLDRSAAGPEALRWAAALQARTGDRVVTLHVVPPGVVSRTLAAVALASGTIVPDPVDHRREPTSTAEWEAMAAAAGVPQERLASEVVFGEPAAEIATAARRLGAGLLVMGRHGAGAFGTTLRRAMLGSVTDAVLRDPPCPVLVVPERPAGAE